MNERFKARAYYSLKETETKKLRQETSALFEKLKPTTLENLQCGVVTEAEILSNPSLQKAKQEHQKTLEKMQLPWWKQFEPLEPLQPLKLIKG